MSTYTIFDGHKLDEEVEGFMTLKVNGSRFAGVDVESNENPSDGSTFVNRRVPLRTIEITFAIMATGEKAILAENQLQSILHTKEPCKLMTHKEPDVYFNALCTSIELDEDMRTVRNGTIKFECFDPFKHAVETKTFTATKNSDGVLAATVENTGNVATSIDYEITMNSDNGFIGIVSDEV